MLAKMDLFKEERKYGCLARRNEGLPRNDRSPTRIGDNHPSEDEQNSGNRPGSKGHEFGGKSRINIGCSSAS
jgi:hypothetical protein